jgi:hypothetical protein
MVLVEEKKDRNIIQLKVMQKDMQKSQISPKKKETLIVKDQIVVLLIKTSLKNVKNSNINFSEYNKYFSQMK